MKEELIFINNCKDHVKSSDASLKQYIFLQINVYWTSRSKFVHVYIDHALPATKPKQIKWIMTSVCLNGHSELNTQYFFIGMVWFESQEYTLQGSYRDVTLKFFT